MLLCGETFCLICFCLNNKLYLRSNGDHDGRFVVSCSDSGIYRRSPRSCGDHCPTSLHIVCKPTLPTFLSLSINCHISIVTKMPGILVWSSFAIIPLLPSIFLGSRWMPVTDMVSIQCRALQLRLGNKVSFQAMMLILLPCNPTSPPKNRSSHLAA